MSVFSKLKKNKSQLVVTKKESLKLELKHGVENQIKLVFPQLNNKPLLLEVVIGYRNILPIC